MSVTSEMLPICRANELAIQTVETTWLIQSLWAHAAVGIIGGAPKCCKSWLGIDMAVSVASGTPCLGRFPVQNPGPTLVYLAEDSIPVVRSRIDALCAHRRLDIHSLNLFAITASSLRLDLASDQKRLHATLASLRPRLVLLDPLVRLHRLDENSAAEISNLLGFVREMQRIHDTAMVLVHHASKKHHAQPGQSLRGSSDLHAFGDSNAYLARNGDRLILTLEHRAAKPPDPLELALLSRPDGSATHLQITSTVHDDNAGSTLEERALTFLNHADKPLSRTTLRDSLKVNNQRLGDALLQLQQQNMVLRTESGWVAVNQTNRSPQPGPLNHIQSFASHGPHCLETTGMGTCSLPT
ncbi:MAG TPA: AAA family ATPase [Magnetococcales bacterium]|nr:AAA family ATPase [Magnetococcales bacterium]